MLIQWNHVKNFDQSVSKEKMEAAKLFLSFVLSLKQKIHAFKQENQEENNVFGNLKRIYVMINNVLVLQQFLIMLNAQNCKEIMNAQKVMLILDEFLMLIIAVKSSIFKVVRKIKFKQLYYREQFMCKLNLVNIQSCEKDKIQIIVLQRIIYVQTCENLKFPNHINPKECEQRLSIRTYDVFKKRCVDKVMLEFRKLKLQFDFSYKKCIIPSGCRHIQCESASLLLQTHQDCQNRDVKCTINILVIADIIYNNGCITKSLDCSEFTYQEQCTSSLQNIPCYWNTNKEKCEFHNCDNAPINLTTNEQCNQWIKYHNLKFIAKLNSIIYINIRKIETQNLYMECLSLILFLPNFKLISIFEKKKQYMH